MDVAVNAAKAGSSARSLLSGLLRESYPWLPEDRLVALLNNTAATIEQELVKQEPIMVAARSRSSFFALSAELRNRIYDLVLGEDQSVLIENRPIRYGGYYPAQSVSMGSAEGITRHPVHLNPGSLKLLTLTKQVRAEVLPMFWDRMKIKVAYRPQQSRSINSVLVCGPASDWLRLIGKENATLIRSFTFLAEGGGREEQMQKQSSAVGSMQAAQLSSFGLRGSAVSIEYCEGPFSCGRSTREWIEI